MKIFRQKTKSHYEYTCTDGQKEPTDMSTLKLLMCTTTTTNNKYLRSRFEYIHITIYRSGYDTTLNQYFI